MGIAMPNMKTGPKGIALIKEFEGLELTAYLCPAKVWTVAHGHTSAAGAPKVFPGMKVTAAEAEEILKRDLGKYEAAVNSMVNVPLTQEQFDCLVSWCYNVGPGNFAGSTLLRKLSSGDYASVPAELNKWTRAGKAILSGLVRRRKAEGALWSTKAVPVTATPPKPSFFAAIAALFKRSAV